MLDNATPGPPESAPTLADASALELYEWLTRCRYALFGDLKPADREDAVHETLVRTLQFADRLRNPDALHGACYTIGLRVRAGYIREYMRENYHAPCPMDLPISSHPEHHLIETDRRNRLLIAIRTLGTQDQEIIRRFYYEEQTKEQIWGEMHLTATQFRLRKTRAISKAGRRARAMLAAMSLRFDCHDGADGIHK